MRHRCGCPLSSEPVCRRRAGGAVAALHAAADTDRNRRSGGSDPARPGGRTRPGAADDYNQTVGLTIGPPDLGVALDTDWLVEISSHARGRTRVKLGFGKTPGHAARI